MLELLTILDRARGGSLARQGIAPSTAFDNCSLPTVGSLIDEMDEA